MTMDGTAPAAAPLCRAAPDLARAHAAALGRRLDPHAPLTVEEARAGEEAADEILRRSGLGRGVEDFAVELGRAEGAGAAYEVVRRHGVRLWRAATRRAQGADRRHGDLPSCDDRPLYWARLRMIVALRQWRPVAGIDAAEQAGLVTELERGSRGWTSIRRAPAQRPQVVVTGFDPFRLDVDICRANPSGAAALALAGQVLACADTEVEVCAALFPVRWRDFTDGVVEQVLAPHLLGPRPARAVITVSQGRAGRFDLEAYNGAWRGGAPDNEGAGRAEPVPPPPVGLPALSPLPQWTVSTLPRATIAAAETGRFPVVDNTRVVEIPAGMDSPVERPHGPTPGSTAREGGGGDYLSNEIAYRNTVLREVSGRSIPAGHLHTPIPRASGPAVVSAEFIRDLDDIVTQVRRIVATVVAG
ncbi:pyroglutamyl peptidase [Marinactinospora thermotolerans]|uniref:pyroglutamyl peptidase n=1 Tax=Marinactinospora thermotolerans TaxID=531310 RepID=UPI003D8E719A